MKPFAYFRTRSIVVLLLCVACSISADPLDHWHLRWGWPTRSTLNGITFGNGMFVAVGDAGTILTSSDQINWLPRTSGTTLPLRGITHANGLFVAVGGSTDATIRSVVVTSSDGISWLVRSGGTSQELHSVAFGNGVFAATGLNGTIVTSPDGITWARRTSQTPRNLSAIAYGNSTFMAVGVGGTFARSADGVSWTTGSAGTNTLFGIGFGAANFVAVAGDQVLLSADGSQWRETPPRTGSWLYGVAFHDNQFILVGEGETIVRLAEDFHCHGVRRTGQNGYLLSSAFGNGEFVAVGGAGLILRSRDGNTWAPLNPAEPVSLNQIAYGNGRFFTAGGDGGSLLPNSSLTSFNGTEWFSAGTPASFDSIAFAKDSFVAFGLDYSPDVNDSVEAIFLSTDGIHWDRHYMAGSRDLRLNSVAHGNGQYVAVGEEFGTGVALTSSDGLTWTQTYLPVNPPGWSGWGIAFGNGTFVTEGGNGSILSSSDGVDWTIRRENPSEVLFRVAYGGGLFVAVGGVTDAPGLIFTSTDGIT